SYFTAEKQTADDVEDTKQNPMLSVLFIVIGISMLVGGGILFVDGAVAMAKSFGISEVIIGLTIVAIGTSMPELVTSIVAALKGQSDIAIGNVVGSNIFNVLGILGVTALIHPIIGSEISNLDWAAMIALAVLLLPFAYTGLRIGRREAGLLIAGYFAYIGYIVLQAI
ncbi:sodium:calcium antiporter, partial [Shewanella sp. 0m-11]